MDNALLEGLLTPGERDRVELWRSDELERAGFPHAAAHLLGTHLEVDLHQALDLIERGCSPELALRILL